MSRGCLPVASSSATDHVLSLKLAFVAIIGGPKIVAQSPTNTNQFVERSVVYSRFIPSSSAGSVQAMGTKRVLHF